MQLWTNGVNKGLGYTAHASGMQHIAANPRFRIGYGGSWDDAFLGFISHVIIMTPG